MMQNCGLESHPDNVTFEGILHLEKNYEITQTKISSFINSLLNNLELSKRTFYT